VPREALVLRAENSVEETGLAGFAVVVVEGLSDRMPVDREGDLFRRIAEMGGNGVYLLMGINRAEFDP
jgi:hypothetical protein